MSRIFRIHPAFGIARVGNASRDTAFVGPELPGVPANFDPATGTFGPFKQGGLVRPQAAEFRVWEYEKLADGTLAPKREAFAAEDGVLKIEWSVHLANRKAAFFEFHGQTGAADSFAAPPPLRNVDVAGPDREVRLVIDPGAKTISGPNAGPVELANNKTNTKQAIPDLGELRTDALGRLRVIGGRGATLQTGDDIHDYVNNDGWFDDVGDGPVSAIVTVQGPNGAETVEAEGAWVSVAPPDFAPAIGNVVSLYETMWDVAVRSLPTLPQLAAFATGGLLEKLRLQHEDWKKTGTGFTDYEPSFVDEIAPLLERAFTATFVHSPQPGSPFHTTIDPSMWSELVTDDEQRRTVFARLRDPDGTNPGAHQMPKGLGDEYVDEGDVPAGDPRRSNARRFFSLTRTQYALMRQWSIGKFKKDGEAPRAPLPSAAISPEGLDRSALENCVGGPFFPGIEISWLVRKPEIYSEPFRIALGSKIGPLTVGPGFFTQQMALPWQADFRDCTREPVTDPLKGNPTSAMWWAAQRPDDVYPEVDPTGKVPWTRAPHFLAGDDEVGRFAEMKDNWFKQGFVAKRLDGKWVETERNE
jgi:hypothetical protein